MLRRRFHVFLLLGLLFAGPLFAQQDETRLQLEAHYSRLEKLDYETLMKGNSLADYQEREKIRDFFRSHGDAGARFLIAKLQEAVADEVRFMGDSKELVRATEYMIHLNEKGKSSITKVLLPWMLADMFPGLSPELQKESLRAITAAFLPFSFPSDWSSLTAALFRIGPVSLPYLLELTGHEDEKLRCHVSDTLNDVSTKFSKPATWPGVDAPKLDCQLEPAQLQGRIQQWKHWWDSHGSMVAWPQIPSFFEIYKQFPDRIK
jgi:hypothetical protein